MEEESSGRTETPVDVKINDIDPDPFNHNTVLVPKKKLQSILPKDFESLVDEGIIKENEH